MSDYLWSFQYDADRFKSEALDSRRFAHFMRRGGNIGSFKQWMRDARRAWRMHKYFQRKAAIQ